MREETCTKRKSSTGHVPSTKLDESSSVKNTTDLNSLDTTLDVPPYLFVVCRKCWGALPPKAVDPKPFMTTVVVLTYGTDVNECYTREKCTAEVRQLQIRQMESGLPDIAYNFVIGGDMKAYVGRGWHANPRDIPGLEKYKGYLIEIAFLGDYRVTPPHDDMFDAVYDLVHYGRQNSWVQEGYSIIDNYE